MEAFHNVDLQSNYHDQDEYKCIPEKNMKIFLYLFAELNLLVKMEKPFLRL